MAVPGRISAGRAGPAESAWPPETKVRTECLLGSPKHPSRSATGRVLSPQSRRPAERRSTPAGCVRTPKASSARRTRSRPRPEIRGASSRFMGSGCEGTAIGSSLVFAKRAPSDALDAILDELRRSSRSLDRLRTQVRSSLDGSLAQGNETKGCSRRDHKSVSELSVKVDDKLRARSSDEKPMPCAHSNPSARIRVSQRSRPVHRQI